MVETKNQTLVAGDSMADILMRIMIIPIVDEVLESHPYIYPAVVADDVQLLAIGTERFCKEVSTKMSLQVVDVMASSQLPFLLRS